MMNPLPESPPAESRVSDTSRQCGVSVIIVNHNRIEKLERTLSALDALEPRPEEIIVVDNASSDVVCERLRREERIRLISLRQNVGVQAFNIGAAEASFPNVLILDDDAAPERESWRRANEMLMQDPRPDAIVFNPVHPESGASEWPDATRPSVRFNRMGCCNLIRTLVWREAGGYIGAYFLYRNDTDLALTLLARGKSVVFDPAIVAYHDSPFAARKSELWLRLATRNWIWMARRHGRGPWKYVGIFAGVFRALSRAGLSITRLFRVLQGLKQGMLHSSPQPAPHTDGAPWRDLIKDRFRNS